MKNKHLLEGPQVLTQAIAGTRVKLVTQRSSRTDGHTITFPTVGEYHPSKPSNSLGHWYCVTHEQHFDNRLGKDFHIINGTHQLAWICHEHGIEQPLATEEIS